MVPYSERNFFFTKWPYSLISFSRNFAFYIIIRTYILFGTIEYLECITLLSSLNAPVNWVLVSNFYLLIVVASNENGGASNKEWTFAQNSITLVRRYLQVPPHLQNNPVLVNPNTYPLPRRLVFYTGKNILYLHQQFYMLL